MTSLITDLTDDDIRTVWPGRAEVAQADDDATDTPGGADDDAADADDDAADADDDAADADQDGTDA
jgi:hypothetical protein